MKKEKCYLTYRPILKTLRINGLLLKDSDFVYNKKDNTIERTGYNLKVIYIK